MDELLTLEDVARELKISIHTVRQWRARGIIKVLKLPTGMIRVRRSELSAMLEAAGTA